MEENNSEIVKLMEATLLRQMWDSLTAEDKRSVAQNFFAERLSSEHARALIQILIRDAFREQVAEYVEQRKSEYLAEIEKNVEAIREDFFGRTARRFFEEKLRDVSKEFAQLFQR